MPRAVKPELVEQDNLEVAQRLAQERWRSLDPKQQAARAGAEVRPTDDGQHIVTVSYFAQDIEVTHPGGEVRRPDGSDPLKLPEQILVLHYLCAEGAIPDGDRVIAYSEIPDGRFYDDAYQRRTKNFLLAVFGKDPDRMAAAAKALKAEPAELGDVSVRVRALPLIDIYPVLWKGDEEFPADASVLLGDRIRGFFNAEDTAVVAGLTVSYLARVAAKQKAGG
jgi:hypothetical protein